MRVIKLILFIGNIIFIQSVIANDIKHYENFREGIRSQLITYHKTLYIISVSEKSSTCLIKAKVENDKAYFQPVKLIVEGDVDSNGSLTIKYLGEKIVISDFSPPDYCGLFTDITGVYNLKDRNDFLLTEYFSSSSLDELVFIIKNKSYLYKNNQKTQMYLIKGDKVTLLDEKTDASGQKWYFINYKGKKELNMWIKAEAVDLEPQAEKTKKEAKPDPAIKPKTKNPEPVTKAPTNKPAEIAQVTLTNTPPKNAEKSEPIKSAKGSTSFVLLASMFGLLSLRKSIM